MTEAKKLQVFLCHASADKPKVRELYKFLRRRGINPWLDAEDLLPGQDWQVEIPKAILTSDAIIVCLSKNSVTKEGYIQKEITFALDKAQEKPEGTIFIIPAKLEECDVPARLNRYQWVDLHEEGGYERLMRGLRLRATQLKRSVVETTIGIKADNNKEEEQFAHEKAESEKLANQKAESERIEIEQVEAEKLAREKAENERIALEKARAEKLAAQKAEEDRIARAKVEEDKPEKQKAKKEIEQLERYLASQTAIAKRKAENERIAQAREQRARFARAMTWERLKIPALIMGGGVALFLLWRLALAVIPVISVLTSPPDLTPAGTVMISEKDGMNLHYVPAGDFLMGDNNQKTYVYAFWIDETEVTNRMYALCVAAGACQPPSDKSSYTRQSYYDDMQYADYPVIYVDWNQAKTYCEWAGRALPTENQWEKAARGTDGRAYPWDNVLPNKDLSNYNKNVGDTTKIGLYPNGKSPYGALDMAGNVSEWVNDWYDSNQQYRGLRGGSWLNLVDVLRVPVRYGYYPDSTYYDIGFRCSRSPTPEVFATETPLATFAPTKTKTPPPATFTPAPPIDILFTPTTSITLTPAAGDVTVSEKDGMNLHYVPAGNFLMGVDNQTTYVDAFWIDETEVTNRMYALCVAASVCQPPSDKSSYTRQSYYDDMQYADYPVIYVDWNQAKTYCEWAGRELPTEKQWEKAARGTDGRAYPWGNDAPNKDLSNYNKNVGDTTEVGSYKDGKSPYGALDMAGNVWEWVNGWWDSSQRDRVLRGGWWSGNEFFLRFSSLVRAGERSDVTGDNVGFRCARSR